MSRFEQLEVWKRSVEYAGRLMGLAEGLPQRYQFSLGEQLRRAGLSIGANIAEGSGRGNGREAGRFYRIARGSIYEVVSLLEVMRRQGFVEEKVHQLLYGQADEIARMLTGLMRRNSRAGREGKEQVQ